MSDAKDQGFTKEQLEELQIDAMTGGDIPFIGAAGMIGRKGIPKVLEFGEKIVKDVYEHYAAKKAAKEAAEALTLQELRATLEPLEDVVKKGIEAGKINPSALEKNYQGADLLTKNMDDLRRYVGDDKLRGYAKLALEDEAKYRETLNPASRFLRAFHYDNANPEVGYLIGPSRYGGTYKSHLEVTAADTELEAGKIAVLNMVRGTAQVVGVSVAAVNVAIDHYTDDKKSNKKAPAEKPTSDQVLGEALKLSPELRGQAEQTLAQMRDDYSKMSAEDKAKIGDENTYMDKAKLSVAKEIATMKLEQHEAQKSAGANQQSNAGNRDLNQQLAAFNQHIDTLPEHQQQTVRSAMALYLNKHGAHVEEAHTQNQAQQQELV